MATIDRKPSESTLIPAVKALSISEDTSNMTKAQPQNTTKEASLKTTKKRIPIANKCTLRETTENNTQQKLLQEQVIELRTRVEKLQLEKIHYSNIISLAHQVLQCPNRTSWSGKSKCAVPNVEREPLNNYLAEVEAGKSVSFRVGAYTNSTERRVDRIFKKRRKEFDKELMKSDVKQAAMEVVNDETAKNKSSYNFGIRSEGGDPTFETGQKIYLSGNPFENFLLPSLWGSSDSSAHNGPAGSGKSLVGFTTPFVFGRTTQNDTVIERNSGTSSLVLPKEHQNSTFRMLNTIQEVRSKEFTSREKFLQAKVEDAIHFLEKVSRKEEDRTTEKSNNLFLEENGASKKWTRKHPGQDTKSDQRKQEQYGGTIGRNTVRSEKATGVKARTTGIQPITGHQPPGLLSELTPWSVDSKDKDEKSVKWLKPPETRTLLYHMTTMPLTSGSAEGAVETYISISMMYWCREFSVEELRLADYTAGDRGTTPKPMTSGSSWVPGNKFATNPQRPRRMLRARRNRFRSTH